MASKSFNTGDNFELAVALGAFTDVAQDSKFAYNPNLAADVESLVWPGPTATYTFPSDTGQAMELVSSNAGDTQTIRVSGLSSEWDTIEQDVVLTGTTPVAIPTAMSRVNRIFNVSSTATAGNVTLRPQGGGATFALMQASEQISMQLVFSIPRSYKAKLLDSYISVNKTGGVEASVVFRYRRRNFGGVFTTAARLGVQKSGSSASNLLVGSVNLLEPKSDVMLLAMSSVVGADVSARTPYLLIKVSD